MEWPENRNKVKITEIGRTLSRGLGAAVTEVSEDSRNSVACSRFKSEISPTLAARMLACHAGIIPAILNAHGQPVDRTGTAPVHRSLPDRGRDQRWRLRLARLRTPGPGPRSTI